MRRPLFSIIVTTKNNTSTLDACLQSIAAQTYKPTELIIVDNFSTDNTLEIAKRYTNKVWTQGPERTVQRNFAIGKASGEYVVIIDSDMELAPEVIEQCATALADKSVAGVTIPEESFGEGFWAQCKRLERSFYVGVPWIEAARAFHRTTLEKLGGYDESLVSGEDWDLSKRAERFGKIVPISAFIRHNEGRINLPKTLKKKYYYAQHAKAYLKQNPVNSKLTAQQGPLRRYKLFFSRPTKLFKNPILGLGMLFMKTSEFTAGAAGYFKPGKS